MPHEQEMRRAEDLVAHIWPELENRLRKVMEESMEKLELRIYERSFDPLKERVDMQDRFCAAHSQELTKAQTLLGELVDAHLIRRLEVAEARIGVLNKTAVVLGTISGTALGGVIMGLLTHSITL